jgi:hypothetical protein
MEVPGLAGYLGRRQQLQQENANQFQQLGQAANLAGVLDQKKDEDAIKQVVTSGAPPEQVVTALMSLGTKGAAAAHQYATALKELQTAKATESLRGLTPEQLNEPDTLDRLGASGLPGTAHFTAKADRLRKKAEDATALAAMRSAPAVQPDPQEISQAADDLGGQGAPAPAVVPARPGHPTLEALVSSENPQIASLAKNMQMSLNKSGNATPASTWETRIENLAKMDAQQSNARANKPTEPLEKVVGPDGKVAFATRADVVSKGLTPWVGSPDQIALKVTGGKESVYVQRMMMGANQAAKDLSNVVQLPLTASTGMFGGRGQAQGILNATKEVLANKATGQEAQAYNAMATGFQRSLAQIESAGLMPSGTLTHQMDSVLFKEGDTNLTKLHKLAQTRQIVEAGMEVIQANPRVSPEEKAKVGAVLESIRKSVPFTHSDLIQLQVAQSTNPQETLKDVLKNQRKSEAANTFSDPEKERKYQEWKAGRK